MISLARPDPDDLLKVVNDEVGREGRGRLRIFFGAWPGVGKTYAMLQAAQQRQAQGTIVRIGVLDDHDHADILHLSMGLRHVPLRTLAYRGHMLRELDLDGILVSGAQLVLVDELAHDNVAGLRHAKRWQDVEELIAGGIDVYTTLNVQHLESAGDIVSGIIGSRVREMVPDRVFDAADVVLVDLPPEDLLDRLDAGKVAVPAAMAQARQHFFREGNLIALRELALRRVADRVNRDVGSYRTHHAIGTVWPTRERLLVCVSADRSQGRLIAEGARLAQRLQAEWIVVHVEQPETIPDEAARECVLGLARQAESLGAEFLDVFGRDIAEALLDCAHRRNATKLILGHGRRRRHRPWHWHWRLSERIARANPELGLLLVPVQQAAPRPQPPTRANWKLAQAGAQAGALAVTTCACALTTVVAGWLLHVFDPPNVFILFVLTVIVATLRLGRLAGTWAAVLSVGCFDFFFVPPRLSFAVSDTQYLFAFALILLVALVTGQLASRLRAEVRVARAGERREAAVARVARDLSGAMQPDRIAAICDETIAPLFDARVALMLPDPSERLIAGRAGCVEQTVAQWVFDHGQPAGLGTQTLRTAPALYLPLKAPTRTRGVLAVQPNQRTRLGDPDDLRLLDACCSSIALALERMHFVAVAQDTSVRIEGERLRNALLAAVSHDLRTPLTAIRGLAETLEQPSDLAAAEQTELAAAIRVQAEDLQRLVTNLLDLARMQSAGVRLNREWHALGEIVGSALSRFGSRLAKGRVRTSLPNPLPLVEVDATLIERVLVNLIDNALKYTQADSTIFIAANALGTSLYCCVEDDGPGLAVVDPEELFEAFRRGKKESPISGVGLGLALCRSIVGAHGGTIRAEPGTPTGARFEIRLPLGAPPEIEKEDGL
jgi:two-component system sensor histidine kinase KdpD